MRNAKHGVVSAGLFFIVVGTVCAGEIDAALEKAIVDVEATGAGVSIVSSPEFHLEVDHDMYRSDDPFFDALPKLDKLRKLTIGLSLRADERTLTSNAVKRLAACKQLETLDVTFREMAFEDLLALDALPNLKSLTIRCFEGDPMPDIIRYLQRPEAAKLESIGLSASQISDADCESLAALPNLRDFELRSRTASVSEDGLVALAKKGNLRSIALLPSDVHFDALSALAAAKDLESFEMELPTLDDDGLTNIVTQFPKLRQLNLSQTRVISLQPLRGMTSLEKLNVTGLVLGPGGLKYLAPLVNLKELRAAACRLDDTDAEVVSSLTNLESLDLSSNDQISQEGIASIGKLVNLKSLFLQGVNNFRDGLNDFGNLTKLERLYAGSDAITPAGMKSIENFHNLQELDLSSSAIGDGGLVGLRKLTSLRVLNLQKCDLQDADLANLAGLKNLRDLHLSSNDDLTDAGIAHLAGLTNLRGLSLRQQSLTDESCLSLQGMTRMHSLFLGANELTDKGLAAFANMPGLYRLQLLGTVTLNENGLASLQQLKGLHTLRIRLSKKSRVSAQELADALPDRRLEINGRQYDTRQR